MLPLNIEIYINTGLTNDPNPNPSPNPNPNPNSNPHPIYLPPIEYTPTATLLLPSTPAPVPSSYLMLTSLL